MDEYGGGGRGEYSDSEGPRTEGGSRGDTTNVLGCDMDTTYPRSFEGLLRIMTVPFAALGLIFIIAALFASVGGFFFVVGFWYIVYVIIVFVIEMCIPNVYVHRLIDAIIVFAYAGLWLFSAVLNTAYAAALGSVLLGLAALCGYACCVLCIAQGVFALKTWKTYQGGKRGSQPIVFV